MLNRLAGAKSPYLQKAQNQPVDWFEWGDEAFVRAKELDRPILLSAGGTWCHWCHVMAHESFENEEIAAVINEHFIPVKVDRDERPDIDRRYQDAVLKTTGSGGWPLTAFLTPEGKFFYGGTYFPPEPRWEKPGFKTLLYKLSELYRTERGRIEEVAEEFYRNSVLAASMDVKADAGPELIERGVSAILSAMDMNYGGLGKAPKFHHASALEFLINYLFFNKNESISKGLVITLDGMAKGGIHDHLLGGFFRYSTDEKWLVPHFEKMLYDNAELLKLYSIAYRVFGNKRYKEVADGIVTYYKIYGGDNAGGFYASQDADIGLLDEGGYYTFSSEELASIVTADELQSIKMHFGISTIGQVHHDPSKNVLFVDREPGEIAESMHRSIPDIENLIQSAKVKMLRYREDKRDMPYIDRTIYANWNGLMIEALCIAGNLFSKSEYIALAEKAARRICAEYYSGRRILHREGVPGFLEDYLFFANGLLELYQTTQKEEYLKSAKELVDAAIELFWDSEGWGFFDAERGGKGYLGISVKNIQDSPVQSANGIAPSVLLLIAAATGDVTYMNYAEMTLNAFAALTEDYPLLSYSYLLSLHAFQKGIYKVETSQYYEQAVRDFRPYKFVVRKDVEGVLVCERDTCRKYDRYNSHQVIL